MRELISQSRRVSTFVYLRVFFFFLSFLTSIGDGAGIFHPKAKVRPDNVGGAMTKLFKRFDWEQETAWLEVPSPPLVRRLTSLGNGLGLLGS